MALRKFPADTRKTIRVSPALFEDFDKRREASCFTQEQMMVRLLNSDTLVRLLNSDNCVRAFSGTGYGVDE